MMSLPSRAENIPTAAAAVQQQRLISCLSVDEMKIPTSSPYPRPLSSLIPLRCPQDEDIIILFVQIHTESIFNELSTSLPCPIYEMTNL